MMLMEEVVLLKQEIRDMRPNRFLCNITKLFEYRNNLFIGISWLEIAVFLYKCSICYLTYKEVAVGHMVYARNKKILPHRIRPKS